MADSFNTLTRRLFDLTLPPLDGYGKASALAPDNELSKWDLASIDFYHSRWLEAAQQESLVNPRLRSDRVADLNQAMNSVLKLVQDAEALARLLRGHADWFGGLDDLASRAETVRNHLKALGVAGPLSLVDPSSATKLVQETDPSRLEFEGNRLAEVLVKVASRARDKCRSYIRRQLDGLCDPRRLTPDWDAIVQRRPGEGDHWKYEIEKIAKAYGLDDYACAAVPPTPPGTPRHVPPGSDKSRPFGPPPPPGTDLDPPNYQDFFSDPVPPFGEGWAQASPPDESATASLEMSLGQSLGLRLQGDEVLDAGIEWIHEADAQGDAAGELPEASAVAIVQTAVLSETLGLLRAQTDGIAASAFDAYASAMESAVDSGHFSAAGIGKAMRASTKQSLLSIGQQAASKGAFEIAEAVGSSADGEGAGKHLAAAGKWFLVAGLAGAGAAAVGGGEDGVGSKDRKRDEVAPNGADSEGRDASKGRVIQRIRVVGNPTDVQVGEIKGRLASGARGRAH